MVEQWEIVVADRAIEHTHVEKYIFLCHELRRGTRIAVRTWARQHSIERDTLRHWLLQIQCDADLRLWLPLVRDRRRRYVLAMWCEACEVLDEGENESPG